MCFAFMDILQVRRQCAGGHAVAPVRRDL